MHTTHHSVISGGNLQPFKSDTRVTTRLSVYSARAHTHEETDMHGSLCVGNELFVPKSPV